jgi:hypothetical protein
MVTTDQLKPIIIELKSTRDLLAQIIQENPEGDSFVTEYLEHYKACRKSLEEVYDAVQESDSITETLKKYAFSEMNFSEKFFGYYDDYKADRINYDEFKKKILNVEIEVPPEESKPAQKKSKGKGKKRTSKKPPKSSSKVFQSEGGGVDDLLEEQGNQYYYSEAQHLELAEREKINASKEAGKEQAMLEQIERERLEKKSKKKSKPPKLPIDRTPDTPPAKVARKSIQDPAQQPKEETVHKPVSETPRMEQAYEDIDSDNEFTSPAQNLIISQPPDAERINTDPSADDSHQKSGTNTAKKLERENRANSESLLQNFVSKIDSQIANEKENQIALITAYEKKAKEAKYSKKKITEGETTKKKSLLELKAEMKALKSDLGKVVGNRKKNAEKIGNLTDNLIALNKGSNAFYEKILSYETENLEIFKDKKSLEMEIDFIRRELVDTDKRIQMEKSQPVVLEDLVDSPRRENFVGDAKKTVNFGAGGHTLGHRQPEVIFSVCNKLKVVGRCRGDPQWRLHDDFHKEGVRHVCEH